MKSCPPLEPTELRDILASEVASRYITDLEIELELQGHILDLATLGRQRQGDTIDSMASENANPKLVHSQSAPKAPSS